MNFEKYTERARGFVQSAQTMALGRGHQQFAPEHLLKVLLDDPEGMAAGLINAAGGDAGRALAAVDRALDAMPRVSGGNGQLYLTAPMAKVFATAEAMADKAGDSFVTVERLLDPAPSSLTLSDQWVAGRTLPLPTGKAKNGCSSYRSLVMSRPPAWESFWR